jgi:hypothetical protein
MSARLRTLLRTHFEMLGTKSFVAAFFAGIFSLGIIATPMSFALASQSESTRAGGSSDILVVQARDAYIIYAREPQIGQIILEPIVFEVLWDGVVEGEFQYLRIDDRRFFIAYSEADYAIYAYDCLGYQYLIRPKASNNTP